MKKVIFLGSLAALLPNVSFAAATFQTIIGQLQGILSVAVPILITVMVVIFIWTVIQYTMTTDEKKKEAAKSGIIRALIGVFVIVSFWGIIRLINNSLNIDTTADDSVIPYVPLGY
jgi:phage-related holin